jgi:hypothetical protein
MSKRYALLIAIFFAAFSSISPASAEDSLRKSLSYDPLTKAHIRVVDFLSD